MYFQPGIQRERKRHQSLGESLCSLRFADDEVVFSHSIRELKKMITRLNNEGKQMD